MIILIKLNGIKKNIYFEYFPIHLNGFGYGFNLAIRISLRRDRIFINDYIDSWIWIVCYITTTSCIYLVEIEY